MTKITQSNGSEVDFDAAVNLMDSEVMDTVNQAITDTDTNQTYFDAYCAAHEAKYGEEFIVN